MSITPFISVVMANYNGEPYLESAVESILRQSFGQFEFIIIDDGSTDHSWEILNNIQDLRIKLFQNKTNLGLTRSLNKGLSIAKGELIARQDADDISFPNRFIKQVDYLNNHPNVALVGTAYEVIDSQSKTIEQIFPPQNNQEIQHHLIKTGNCICHGSVMIRRTCLDQVGGYREEFTVTQDYDLWLRMAEHYPLSNLEDIHYQLRFNDKSISRDKPALQLAYRRMAQEFAIHRRKHGTEPPIPTDVLGKYPPEPYRLFRNARRAAFLFYACEQYDKAADAIQFAFDNQEGIDPYLLDWGSWIRNKALDMARLSKSAAIGEHFIQWINKYLGHQLPGVRKQLGMYYSDLAVAEYMRSNRRDTIKYVSRSLAADLSSIKKLQLLKMAIKSLL
jgi:glycosyltransferase involved in cell wall biosynthesis